MKFKLITLAWLACFIILLFARTVAASTVRAQPARPNVLFIAIDDLNTMIGPYDSQALTPNIDRLVSESLLFYNGYAPATVCNPSRISLLTGLRPSSSGITTLSKEHTEWRSFLAEPDGRARQHYGNGIGKIDTLFDHFRKNGYFVASAGKTFHNFGQLVDEKWGLLYTWPFWPGMGWPTNMPLHGMNEYFAVADADWGAIEKASDPDRPGKFYKESDLPDYEIIDNALSILESAPDDKPFFAGVGFLLPHLPWYVPQRMLDLYPPESIQFPSTIPNDLEDVATQGKQLVWQGGHFYDQTYVFDDDEQWRSAVRHYLASVSYVDEQVGRLLDRLEQLGMDENTIIVLWGDNGYHLGEKSHLQKQTLWQEASAVPIVIKVPGMTTGATTDAVVNSVDLFPTLVELAGLNMPTDFHRDGRSLVPLLRDPDAFWPWPATTYLELWNNPNTERAAIRTRGWSYIRYDLNDTGPEREEELYFRITDPFEWHNLLSPLNANPEDYRGVRLYLEMILRGQSLPDAPPAANNLSVTVPAHLTSPIELTGQDPNQDFLIFTVETLPAHGVLYTSPDGINVGEPIKKQGTEVIFKGGWSTQVMYLPDNDATTDAFTFKVSDGISSHTASVNINIKDIPINRLHLPLQRLKK